MKTIRYSKQATKALIKMQPNKASKVKESIVCYASGNTATLNIVAMKNSELIRIRVGDWRVIIHDDVIVNVIKIGARGDIYKR